MTAKNQPDVEICPVCFRPRPPGASVCQQCLKPLIVADAVAPHVQIADEIRAYDAAAKNPSKLALIGMWLIWGPMFLAAVVVFGAMGYQMATAPSGIHSVSDAIVALCCLALLVFMIGGLGTIAGRYLYLTTRNYLRASKQLKNDGLHGRRRGSLRTRISRHSDD